MEYDERMMWEQYKINKMDGADLDLRAIQKRLGDKIYNKLMRFFKGIAKNTNDAIKESQLYLTEDSIVKKLREYFGHKCEFLSRRFYVFLADNITA